MLDDYMKRRNPCVVVTEEIPEVEPEPATEYTSNLNAGYRDNAKDSGEKSPPRSMLVSKILRTTADLLDMLFCAPPEDE